MRAIVRDRYGSPACVLRCADISDPGITDEQVLVRVRAASVNPLDAHYTTGVPYVMRIKTGLRAPKEPRLGTDFAGEVVEVGAQVSEFAPGDEVFGIRTGAFAEFVTVSGSGSMCRKPAGVSFEQAAAVPIAGVTALQGLRDKGELSSGQRVLVVGASGGVGTFAVQIAKALGAAHVTGVCSSRNLDLVRSIGADEAIDYTRGPLAGTASYDVVLDVVGLNSLADLQRELTAHGRLVVISGPKRSRLVGPMTRMVRVMVGRRVGRANMSWLLANVESEDLASMAELMASGQVRSVIDRTYPLADAPAAVEYVAKGHARSKVVITV